MTAEEMQSVIDTQTQQITDLEHDRSDLEAERDSLRAELDALKESNAKTVAELQDTKKLNFTLARQIDTGKAKTLDQMIAEAFK